MRTTIDLPENLLIESKKAAAEERMSLTRLIEKSVRTYLIERRQRLNVARPPVELPVLMAPKVLPGVDLNNTSKLWDLE